MQVEVVQGVQLSGGKLALEEAFVDGDLGGESVVGVGAKVVDTKLG